MRVETNAYEGAHGKRPRGFGAWYFEFTGTTESGVGFKSQATFTANYGMAAVKAMRHARNLGASTCRVLS